MPIPADGLAYYRKYAEAMFNDSPEWTIELVSKYFQKEVGIQPDKADQLAKEAKANVDAQSAK